MREKINTNEWQRKQPFTHFSKFTNPYASITSIVNIDELVKKSKEDNLSFYGLMSHTVLKTLNEIEEFKYVLEGTDVYRYGALNMSFSVLKADNSLNFSRVIPFSDLHTFLKTFDEAKNEAESNQPVQYGSNGMNLIYITCTPWMRITSVQNPMSYDRVDSVPRICWGKYFATPEGYNIDLSLQVNHAFQDGYHMGLFYQKLQKNIEEFKEMSKDEKRFVLRRS